MPLHLRLRGWRDWTVPRWDGLVAQNVKQSAPPTQRLKSVAPTQQGIASYIGQVCCLFKFFVGARADHQIWLSGQRRLWMRPGTKGGPEGGRGNCSSCYA